MDVQIVMKTEEPPIEGATVLKGHSIIEMPQSEYEEVHEGLCFQLEGIEWFPRLVLWEQGGGYTNTGTASCVAGTNGAPLRPVFIRRSGHLACGFHAKFAVKRAVICDVDRWRGDFSISLTFVKVDGPRVVEDEFWRVADIDYSEEIVPEKYAKYIPLINATVAKSECYHCREPHFIREGDE